MRTKLKLILIRFSLFRVWLHIQCIKKGANKIRHLKGIIREKRKAWYLKVFI